jgi:hypothetical protein
MVADIYASILKIATALHFCKAQNFLFIIYSNKVAHLLLQMRGRISLSIQEGIFLLIAVHLVIPAFPSLTCKIKIDMFDVCEFLE